MDWHPIQEPLHATETGISSGSNGPLIKLIRLNQTIEYVWFIVLRSRPHHASTSSSSSSSSPVTLAACLLPN